MDEVVLRVRFPRGPVAVRGFGGAACGEEIILGRGVEKAEQDASALGLFGLEQAGRRKLLRAGNSLAVSLDPELLAEILPGAKPGMEVRVGRVGRRIVIEQMPKKK